jgi:DnaJ-class molecular chaperone
MVATIYKQTKSCKVCGGSSELLIKKKNGVEYVRNLCKPCYGKQQSEYWRNNKVKCEYCRKTLTIPGYDYHKNNGICVRNICII